MFIDALCGDFFMIPLNYKDYTIKAKIVNPGSIESRLKEICAKYIGMDIQTDHYFKIEKGKLKWRQGTIENLITHYERISESGIEKTIVYRYDLNPSDKAVKALKATYAELAVIRKERKIYRVDNIKVHLDKLSDGKQFIEIEAIDSEERFSHDELKAQCKTMKLKLGIEDEDLVATGYMTGQNMGGQ